MKKSAGFTLIELVIVIVILGILGAVAAPRFINMQGDAYEANVKALKGSIQSAMTLANTKAILGGYDKGDDDGKHTVKDGKDLDTVTFIYGFPTADKSGIIAMLQDEDSFGEATGENKNETASKKTYTYVESGDLVIYPTARFKEKCNVTYTAAGESTPASVAVETSGC